ncbi:MAG: hypothetical protein QOJ51_727, partial [Acidobacteriaceae bacterium]|nr:hypothetical protein [Acidobacteriaceae bacterium]
MFRILGGSRAYMAAISPGGSASTRDRSRHYGLQH